MKSLFILVSLLFTNAPAFAIDMNEVSRALTHEGLVARVHGAIHERGLYVVSVRNPADFFDAVELPVVADSPEAEQFLLQLNRHDQVRIKGELIDNHAPVQHIAAKNIELVQKYEGPGSNEPNPYDAQIPEDLLGKTSAVFKVHAIGAEGRMLVLEYKDAVVPMFVKDGSITADLYRGDTVQIEYSIAKEPSRPVHLKMNTNVEKPMVMIDRLVSKHGQTVTYSGTLSLFPKSPQIAFDVYALEQVDSFGLITDYTLVNFENQEAFAAIRAKLAAAWQQAASSAQKGRNRLVNLKIRVTATGMLNVVSPSQANPQILLTGPESVTVQIL